MNFKLIITLLKKDITLFSRDRFFSILTVAGVLIFIILYLVMPGTVDETLKIGIFEPGSSYLCKAIGQMEGIEVHSFSSMAELQEAVKQNRYQAGLLVPDNLYQKITAGDRPEIVLYFAPEMDQETRSAITVMIRQMISAVAGQQQLLQLQTSVLGTDRLDSVLPWRDRLIPVLALVILGTEMLSLASLISTELEQKTIQALLLTPLKIQHIFLSKALLGTGMAFSQVIIFLAVTGGLVREPQAILLITLLGSILVTGLGFLIAALSRNMMNVASWGVIVMILFLIPSYGALFPGLATEWIKLIPSYHLIDGISQTLFDTSGLSAISINLLVLLGWSVTVMTIGVLALRRRQA